LIQQFIYLFVSFTQFSELVVAAAVLPPAPLLQAGQPQHLQQALQQIEGQWLTLISVSFSVTALRGGGN